MIGEPIPQRTRVELLAHAKSRHGWKKLTPTQRERAEQLFLEADTPELGIITTDNVVFRQRLGWSQGQAQRMVRALKDARLISVERQWETLPNGWKRETGPAAWVYAERDMLRPSQIAKRRTKRTEPRLRFLESQVAVLGDDLARVNRALENLERVVSGLS